MIDKFCNHLFVFLLLMSACNPDRKAADLIITGKIYTADSLLSEVEAVAVSADTIVYAGSAEGAMKYKGDSTRTIDLQDRIMTPGFIEGHGHIMGIGYNELNLDLSSVKNFEELVLRVKEAVSKAQPGDWILGRGWHQEKWDHKPKKTIKGFQTHQLLSEISPDNPVFLQHASGHAAMANAKAMQIAGVNLLAIEKLQKKITGDQQGEIIRDEHGNPTGIFVERAMDLIANHIPENDTETDRRALELAFQACLRNGITSFHDAGATRQAIDVFYQFKQEQKLGLRMYVMVEGDYQLLNEWYQKGPDIDPGHWLTIRSIKLHCDGALGSRGAWLLEPYTDRPGFSGMATLSMDTVLKVSINGLKYGFQVCSHAIGDRANREVLNQYEAAIKDNPEKAKDHRFRIEHAQHIDPQDLPRFAKLGVIPAMQAIHMSSDRPWAIDRLGEKRIKEGAYMWQSLLRSGARIVNGTDAPVEPINPIPCFYASVTRKTLKGEPEGGYEPEEKMSREQALRSYTLDAAYGAFEENIKGSIKPGKLADFTVLSKDIMRIPENEILSTFVDMTIVGGKVVYQKK
jgi:predicted amidohydrolase YtcJ